MPLLLQETLLYLGKYIFLIFFAVVGFISGKKLKSAKVAKKSN